MQGKVEIKDKFLLSIQEAAEYFNMGDKKMRLLAKEHIGEFAIYIGTRHYIVRSQLEEYILNGDGTEFMSDKSKNLDEPEGWEDEY